MADSCCVVELKETIEKLNVELSQSRTKISELDAKVREQEEENTRLARNLKECEEKCRATQKRLEFAEQKLAQFSYKPQTAAQIRQNLINDGSSSCSDGSDSDEVRQNPSIGSSSSCSDGPDSDDSPTHISFPPVVKYENSGVGKSVTNITHLFKRKKFDEGTKENNVKTSKLTSILKGISKIRQNLINEGSSSCSDGSDCDEDRQNPISDSSSSCSDGPDSDDSPTQVRHPQIKESSDAVLNINSMPEEIFIKIFGYLSHNDLGRTAQVCTRWNALSRNPDLWKKVNVDFCQYRGSQNFVAECLINILPPRVTSLRLNFWNSDAWIDFLNFDEISVRLQERCPILEMLTLENAKISVNLPSIINLSTMLLQNLRRLALHSSIFPNCPTKEEEECGETCKIEALDLYGCYITHYNKPPLSNMPHLKKLYLSCTDVDDSWFEDVTYFLKQLHELDLRDTEISSSTFQVLQIHAPNLRELCLCDTGVDLDDLNFNVSIFPHLKTICLRYNGVSCEGIISLIKACKSLQNVYVDYRVVYSYEEYVNYNECKLGIVKDDCCYYNKSRYFVVCRTWNVLTKRPVLWRKVNVKIFSSVTEKNTVAKCFINGMPPCVSFIRLDFAELVFSELEDLKSIDFEELCAKLHQNCPHLEVLILTDLRMSNLLSEVINFCSQFLQCVKKLVFHYCHFSKSSRTVELNDNSKIEVLDLYRCDISRVSKTQFSKLLYLKELHLAVANVDDTWFVDDASFFNRLNVLNLGRTYITASTFLAIQRHGHNLKELYLCNFKLLDHDLNFNKSAFPRLKTLCLGSYDITCEVVLSLIQSCPSLQNVYVDRDVAESFAAHPFVVANRCKTGIVKSIVWRHNHKVDYSHN